MASFHRLDSLVSKPLIFKPRSTVTVPYANLTNEERAALVILFKVQDRWPKRFWFEEEKSSETDENSDSEYESGSDSEYESDCYSGCESDSNSECESDSDSEYESDSDSECESDSDSESEYDSDY